MSVSEGHQIASKWAKTNVLKKNSGVSRHIPTTLLYSRAALQRAFANMAAVIAKPVRGTGGNGVILVQKGPNGYDVRHRNRLSRHARLEGAAAEVDRIRRGRPYLIQQAIRLAQINGRPVDYRVKLVNEEGRWVVKAVVGRVAKPGLFVTNLCSGGTQLTSAEAIRRSLSAAQVRPLKRAMVSLAYRSKDVFISRYPGVTRLGFDFGVDTGGRIWLLELNTNPH